MRLRIRNFAKVKEAEIILDGITVIAGKNNTGKSTVGKVLDSMYNSTNNLDGKMINARKSRLRNSLLNIINYAGASTHISHGMIAETAERIFDAGSKDEEIWHLERLCKAIFQRDLEIGSKKLMDEMFKAIEEIKAIPDKVFIKTILSNYFEETFNGNINNAEYSDTTAEVEIEIKSGKNTISFCNNVCVDFKLDYNPVSSSFYLDNPMLIDKLNNPDVSRFFRWYFSEQEYHLYTKLIGERSSAEEKAINEIINRKKLGEVIGLLNQVIPGEITYDQKYIYKTEKSKNGIDVRSLSTGLKSFAILKQLIMNGSLKDKDAIVLDEPEIHLHPERYFVKKMCH